MNRAAQYVFLDQERLGNEWLRVVFSEAFEDQKEYCKGLVAAIQAISNEMKIDLQFHLKTTDGTFDNRTRALDDIRKTRSSCFLMYPEDFNESNSDYINDHDKVKCGITNPDHVSWKLENKAAL